MRSIRVIHSRCFWLFAATVFLGLTTAGAQSNKKDSSPPPKNNAPAQRSQGTNNGGRSNAGQGYGANSGGYHGPTANGTHATPQGSGRMANGPTANGTHATPQGSGRMANGPTANGPSSNRGTAASPAQPSVSHANLGLGGRPAPRGSHQVALKNGSAIQKRSDGRVSDVHNAQRGMDIHHGLNGGTRVSVQRPDGSRIVGERGRPGYIQRSYSFHGHSYARRTYYYQGRTYNRFYRSYSYGGVYMNVYAPGYYYPAGFYGWVYNPWAPISYTWGWGGAWPGYYGYYFAPYPVYPSASLWLTDYMISNDLAAEYQAEQATQTLGGAPTSAGGPALSDDTKQAIADEVRNQLALENNEAQQTAANQDPDPASSGIARLMSDGHSHVFVAGNPLDVVDASGTECALSPGDAVEMSNPPPTGAATANLTVLASKGGTECPKSDTVTLAVADLQDMQNHMRETIDQGLQQLQSQQGQGGLPAEPGSAKGAPVNVAFAQQAPPPDSNGAAEINQQVQQASASEQAVTTQAQQEAGAQP
jgi:hypothetical protein